MRSVYICSPLFLYMIIVVDASNEWFYCVFQYRETDITNRNQSATQFNSESGSTHFRSDRQPIQCEHFAYRITGQSETTDANKDQRCAFIDQ